MKSYDRISLDRDNNNSGLVAEMKVMQTPCGPPGGTGSGTNFSIVENVSSADNHHHQMTPTSAAAAFGAKKRGRPRKGTPTASTGKSMLLVTTQYCTGNDTLHLCLSLCIYGQNSSICPLIFSQLGAVAARH